MRCMMLFQIVFAFFALFAIGTVLKRKKDGSLSTNGALFWIVFWVLAMGTVFVPDSVTLVANHLGIGRGTDLVTYVAFALIFFALFRLHVKLHEVERDITHVVRKDALDSAKTEK